MIRNKWHIIEFDIDSGNTLRKINFKIPINVKQCRGFMFSATEAGQENHSYLLGVVSLTVNNKKSHPIHCPIHSKTPESQTKKNEVFRLGECAEGGAYIQGYFGEAGLAAAYPYKLKIYLDCVIDNG